jgi:hypothetical protein
MNRQTLDRIARNVLAAGLEDACWEGYEAVGLKDQGGVQVPNCVPVKTAGRHPLDGKRKHELLPSSIERKLPPPYSTENEPDPIVHVKFFNPYSRSNQVWLLTEYDPATGTGFGWADLGMGGGELGYIDVGELQGLQKGGLPLIERDLSWRSVPLSKAKALVR